MPLISLTGRHRCYNPYWEWSRAQEAHRDWEQAIGANHPYVREVMAVLEASPHLQPGDVWQARDLAIRVAAQGLAAKCLFAPGTIVRRKERPHDEAIIIGNKPRGFKECQSWWNYHKNKSVPGAPQDCDLVWTVRLNDACFGQSRASD